MNTKAAALTGAIVWGGVVLFVGAVNLARPRYGRNFLQLISSIYPGYSARRTPRQIVVATLYAAADGAAGGALTAVVYNKMSAGFEKRGRLLAA